MKSTQRVYVYFSKTLWKTWPFEWTNSDTNMERLQTAVIQICIFIALAAFVSGCVTIDHAIYTDKHPGASWGDYLYCRVTHMP